MTSKSRALGRALPLSIAAILLLVIAPQLMADDVAARAHVTSSQQNVKKAGYSIGIGFGHHGHYGHGHYRHYRPYRYWYPHLYAYPYFAYHGAWGGYPRSRYFGGLDLNVKPKKTTQVYIDGNYVGVAGSFDGWPEYLWLEPGNYELIFYNPGHETVVRQVEVRPGITLDIREVMQPGESIAVEDLTRGKPAKQPAPRMETRRPPPEPRDRAPAPAPAPTRLARPDVIDARQEPARMLLQVAPADASVYLDGRFLGIAGEIGEQRGGILIDPGEHTLEIVRPGYSNRELTFEAEPGKAVTLEVELDPSASTAGLSV
ncbi:MAG: PEGA domain-containing protein [bacterium]|nr:PEGA domain-containing protein [bacterium]